MFSSNSQSLLTSFWIDLLGALTVVRQSYLHSVKVGVHKMSDGAVSKLLREAASLAMEDDREEGYDALILAAEQIATEHGLESPSRKAKSPGRSLELSYSRDEVPSRIVSAPPMVKLPSENVSVAVNIQTTPRVVNSETAPKQVINQPDSTETDALALLKSMNVEPLVAPKQPANETLDQDVQALLDIAVSEGITLNQTYPTTETKLKPKKEKTTIIDTNAAAAALAKQKYLTRVQQNRAKGSTLSSSLAFQRSSATVGTISTLPSKLSMLLQEADEKPYGDSLRHLYQSSTQEMLLKNMFLITNGTQSRRSKHAEKKGLNSTALQEKLLAKFVDEKHHPLDSQPLSARSHRNETPSVAPSKARRSQSASRSAVDRLAQPVTRTPSAIARKIDPTLKYTTFDDAKEATFRPNLGGKKAGAKSSRRPQDDDDERKEDPRFGFISRQDADARLRREELAFQQGRADYDAKLNKKTCPQCGAKQSYDEVKEKRKLCPNCRLPYGHSLTWNSISKKFFANMQAYQHKVKEHRARVLEEVMLEFSTVERKFFDSKIGKVTSQRVLRKEKKLSKEEEEEFFVKLKEKMAHHEELIKKLEKEVYDELCPFSPAIAQQWKTQRSHTGLDDEDLLSDDEEDEYNLLHGGESNPVKAFMRRYEEDLSLRRLKMPMKYLPVHKYHSKRRSQEFDDLGEDEDEMNVRRKEEAEKESSPPRFRF